MSYEDFVARGMTRNLMERLVSRRPGEGQDLIGRPSVKALAESHNPPRGRGAKWYAEEFAYTEAAPDATDHQLTTAGGVKLYFDNAPTLYSTKQMTKLPIIDGQSVQIARDGGEWRFDASDLSAEVAADTGGGVYRAPDSDPTGASGAWVRVATVFRPQDFASDFGTGGDDLAAMQAAQDAAFAAGGCVELPRGTIRVSNTVVQKVTTRGQGSSATIIKARAGEAWQVERKPNVADDLSNSYTPIWQMGRKTSDPSYSVKLNLVLEGVQIQGLATRPASLSDDRSALNWEGDGIHVADYCTNPRLIDVYVMSCQNGVNTYNYSGHVSWHRCWLTNNFYNWWCDHSGGDYRIFDCVFNQPMFASIGCHGDPAESRTVIGVTSPGIFGLNMYGVHLNYGPFGIYQPDRGISNVRGLVDLVMAQVSFEQIGNRGIQLAAQSLSGKWQGLNTWHSFYTSGALNYRISALPYMDYVYWLGTVDNPITFGAPQTAGTTTGKIGKINTIQGPLTMPKAWALWDTNSQSRVVDPLMQNFELTQAVPAVAISASPQTVNTLSIPVELRNAGRVKVHFETVVAATSADNDLVVRIKGGNASDGSGSVSLGAAMHPVANGRDYINCNVVVNPTGYAYLFVVIENASGTTTLGASGITGYASVSPVRISI